MNSSDNNIQDKILIAGEDYPQTYGEFVEMFPANQSFMVAPIYYSAINDIDFSLNHSLL